MKIEKIFFIVFFGTIAFLAFGIFQIGKEVEAERKLAIEKEQKEIASCKNPMLFKTDTFNERYSLFSYFCQDGNVIIVSEPILGAKISPYLK